MKKVLLTYIMIFGIIAINAQDTSLGWVGRVAGSGFEQVWDLHIDDSDNTYTTGNFSGTTKFIDANGTTSVPSNGDQDAFMVKYDSEGNILWYTAFGGSEDDYCYGVTTDSDNNVFITGAFKGSVDFDPTGTGDVRTSADNFDIFICKYNEDGEYQWTKTIGSGNRDEAKSITTDVNDDIYITGRFLRETDFDPGTGVAELNGANSTPDAFLLKLDNDGNYQWAHKIGSSSGLEIGEVVKDGKDGSVILCGGFDSTVDFDPGTGTSELFGAGLSEIYFTKFDYNGDFRWVKSFQGDGYETCQDLAVDQDGNIYATGWFRDAADFDTGSGVTLFTSEGAEDSFIAKLNPQGNTIWARQIGSPSLEWSYSIAVDEVGDVYTTGFFYSTVDFDPGSGKTELTSEGIEDVFITKLTTDGNFDWAKQVGGSGSDAGYGIEIGDNGDIFIIGSHWGTADLDPESTTFNLNNNGSSDVFVLKINQEVISSIYDNNELASNYSISPNPSAGILSINSLDNNTPYKIEIYTLDGGRVDQYFLPFDLNVYMDLSNLNIGLYVVKIYDKEGVSSVRWIKI